MVVTFPILAVAADKPTTQERVDYCVSIVESGICKSTDSPGRVCGWFYRYAAKEKQRDVQNAIQKLTGWKSLENYFQQLTKDDEKNVSLIDREGHPRMATRCFCRA